MPRDDDLPASTPARARAEARRPRAAFVILGVLVLLVLVILADRVVMVRPGPAQMVVVSRGGQVTAIYGPGQVGFINPWSQARVVYDMALATSDRSGPDAGMPALSAEGHSLTVYGTAYWREGDEDDLRWRFAHIRNKQDAKTDLLQPLMAAAVQAVIGRHRMEEIIHDTPRISAALTADLRERARALLRLKVAEFALTRIEPGESYRQVVAERELSIARAASLAASPALNGDYPNALELERIRRWDGRGIIPDRMDRTERSETSR
ncbi:SPFH domain-containing protein [Roseomonas chloroacetimidivorans]|uniref:SPFH domain-containing protein n=1 Tax=Roseomonas chloroacetimidivorans TaxID=1766656 RepID=UPI003C79572D